MDEIQHRHMYAAGRGGGAKGKGLGRINKAPEWMDKRPLGERGSYCGAEAERALHG